MSWKCAICMVILTITLKAMLTHIRETHTDSSNDSLDVFCGVGGCKKNFKKFNTFWKHVKNHHAAEYEMESEHQSMGPKPGDAYATNDTNIPTCSFQISIPATDEIDLQENIDFALQEVDVQEDEIDDDNTLVEETGSVIQQEEFNEADEEKKTMEKEAAKYLIGLKERHKMTQVGVDAVREGCCEMIKGTCSTMKNDFLRSMEEVCTDELMQVIKERMEEAYENMFNPFENLGSSYFQRKFLLEQLKCNEPRVIQLGERIEQRVKGSKRQAVTIPENMYYVPIEKSVQQLLTNDILFQMFSKESRPENNDFILDTVDGSAFTNHAIFGKREKNCLQIELYYDDLEYCSGLSTKSTKQAMFYYRIGNLPAIYRSKLQAIRALATVDNKIMKKYGMDAVLRPIVQDITTLTEVGWDFTINDEVVHFTGALHFVLGDTPGTNLMLGFKEGVGRARDCCRMCQCIGKHGQSHFLETDFHLMDLEQYKYKCSHIEKAKTQYFKDYLSKQFGINRRCAFMEIPGFDLTEFAPYDLMHVCNEGILPFEIKELLKEWTLQGDGKLFSMSDFNIHFEDFFSQFRSDTWQKPTPITQHMMNEKDNTLHQTASTMECLIIALPFILNGLVDEQNEHFKFLIELLQIYQTLLSTVFTLCTLKALKKKIQHHLQKFKELFPHLDLIPKQHFLIHFPSIIEKHGPPVLYNTGRFENSHQDPKKKITARQNYINVSKSVCDSQVRQEAVEIQNDSPNDYKLFSNDFKTGKLITTSKDKVIYFQDKISSFCNLQVDMTKNVLYNSKHLTIGCLKLIADYTFVAAEAHNDKLFFGLVKNIYIINSKNTFLELQMFNTIGMEDSLNSFEISQQGVQIQEPDMPEGHIFIRPENLVDIHAYYAAEVNGKLYIPTYFNVQDLISLVQSGNGHYYNCLSDLIM